GPDHPLGTPVPKEERDKDERVKKRVFLDAGKRRILTTGFIGRRAEQHRLRRKLREGQRVFVLQGLGGLGKSTLAIHAIRDLLHADEDVVWLWCGDAEKRPEGIAEALVGQLLEYCRERLGGAWEQVVQQVDRLAGSDSVQRFAMYLGTLVQNME